MNKILTPEATPAPPPDRFALARQELLERLFDPIWKASLAKRPWEGVIYPLGSIVDHPSAPERKAFQADGSYLISVPVALAYRPIPDRNQICCTWKRPGPPQRVFFGDRVKPFIELLGMLLAHADDSGRGWRATVRTMGALEQPDPRHYHKTLLSHDGSYITLILIGCVGEKLPAPEHVKVWWPEDLHRL